MIELIELIRSRRTVRRVRPSPVPDSLINSLLEAAMWAPSAHDSQPWRFAVVCTREVREELAREMGRVFRSDLEADGASAVEIEARVRASRRRLSTAPVLIIACLCPRDLQRYPDVDRQAAELTMGAQSVAAAVQNLLLAAAEAGLGAAWMCAPLFCPEVVRRTLALASDWEPQALITVGWPDESPRPSRRRNQDDVVVHL